MSLEDRRLAACKRAATGFGDRAAGSWLRVSGLPFGVPTLGLRYLLMSGDCGLWASRRWGGLRGFGAVCFDVRLLATGVWLRRLESSELILNLARCGAKMFVGPSRSSGGGKNSAESF